jgi:hypothetical protein
VQVICLQRYCSQACKTRKKKQVEQMPHMPRTEFHKRLGRALQTRSLRTLALEAGVPKTALRMWAKNVYEPSQGNRIKIEEWMEQNGF